jgi:hypothetical protein
MPTLFTPASLTFLRGLARNNCGTGPGPARRMRLEGVP